MSSACNWSNRRPGSRSSIVGVLCLCGLALSGCAALPGGGTPALDTVTLTSVSAAPKARHGRVQVLVAEPKALKIFDSQNIVVATSPTALEYLGGVQWADRLPSLVQAKLAESLQNAGVAGGVGLPGQGLAIDYQLITEIRDFAVHTDGGARAHVAVFATVLNDRNGTVRASREFSATVPAGGDYVSALNKAFEAVASDIVTWMGQSL